MPVRNPPPEAAGGLIYPFGIVSSLREQKKQWNCFNSINRESYL